MSEPEGDIVINGAIGGFGSGALFTTHYDTNQQPFALGGYGDSDPNNDTVSVSIQLSDNSHTSQAISPAENVIKTIARIAEAARSNPDA